jgi:hypothetical protein
MCEAGDYAVGAVLGQHREKFFHAIYYTNKVLNENQVNYFTIEKELFCCDICNRKVSVIPNWLQSCCFYRTCSFKILINEMGFKTPIFEMDLSLARVRFGA